MSANNGSRVLTGNRQNPQQPGGLGNNQQQGNQNQTAQNNPMAGLAAMAQRLSGNINGQSNGTSGLYNVGPSRTNFSSLLCLDDTMAEEQLKAQAIQEGGTLANQLVMLCARRIIANPYFKVWRAALERFKSPKKGMPPEANLVEFVNEIDSNQNLYNFILVNAGIQLGSVFAQFMASGDERIRQQRDILEQCWYQCCVDTIYLQYYDFLGNHPDGAQIYYRCSPLVKEVLMELEPKVFELAQSRFTFAGQQCPWRKGQLSAMQQRSVVDNPLLNGVTNFVDMGMQGTYFDPNWNPSTTAPANTDQDGMRKLQEYVQRTANQVKNGTYGSYVNNPSMQTENYPPQVTYGDHDKPELSLENITRENRHQYLISKYATNIPGTDWYVMPEQYVRLIMPTMVMDDGIPFRLRDTRCLGCQVIYRINWQEGTFNFRLVKHNLQDLDIMSALISDPSKLLPFMYEEDGIQKTTFDPTVYETNKFENDGKIYPVGEVKDLEKEPDILVGSKPMKANLGNEETVNRLNVYTKTYDPQNKLDAFVLPMVMTREWKMESNVDMDRFYSDFGMMVHGNTYELTDTARVLRAIRAADSECDSEEFRSFVKPYMTNLVNRWLVECRGYAETRTEAQEANGQLSYLKVGDIFADLEDLIEHLRDQDLPTLRAFMDYKTNTFMRYGIEVLVPREEVKKEFEEKFSKEEDTIMRNALIATGETTIIISRNTVFFNVRKLIGPRTPEAVVLKHSGNPEIFAIVKKALSVSRKHFKDHPQVLIKFDTDEGNKVWVATRSDFDPENVFVLRALDGGVDYTHAWPMI
ncbi:hypothetical protein OBP_127 [Pseudomonas phage OBP]|uniref:hypothetical protein n=1 Tax=Pseudomonas phage OBP TaxID=1124849 RepID=UPI000240D4AD|nr:hypothetical protein OBP_127 [Pseudomonas phage OBP]AEV89564.1 hypothetical protein OBP_127 [Pseudomonas phage OBP]